MELESLIRRAAGREPADLLLTNLKLVDVLAGEIYPAEVAVAGDTVVGIGPGYTAREVVDLRGAYLAPGFLDAHVHVESAMVTPREFARAVVPRGTTTVITDPHEIANVLGLEGIRFMLECAKGSPMSMFVMASSCVPATHMETSGAELDAVDLASFKSSPFVLGLAEVMNFPGVVGCDPGVLAKLERFADRVIDGHAPGLTGQALNAYAAAGIASDHECTTVEEAREKLRRGMVIFLREATNAHNLRTLLPLVTPYNAGRLCLCTDDRQPADLLDQGHIDHLLRLAIADGVDPVVAIRMATWSIAKHFRLYDRGAVAPGRRADLVAFDDLSAPRPRMVWRRGELVARDGELVPHGQLPAIPRLRPTMSVDWEAVDFAIRAEGVRARVIEAIPNQLVTGHLIEEATVRGGEAVADPSRDLLKMAVVERHRASGAVGRGFVRGLGLARGALASSVAHDHHNLVLIGADDLSMTTAARRAAAIGGGLVAAEGEQVLAEVPLPLGGLMSDHPIESVRGELDKALDAAHALGSPLHDPFMAMSFLALEVIPSLKLTDQGLVDVDRFEQVPLWVA
ncbi:MAG: adenine deaminase [Thermoanaerobaculia bacterium]|nr:adenine deaminase [Thermoanaerobaculia bacterium]